ncbi:MAG TPA: CoA transferase [Steroidobacteraceae bacterium]|nr:CoA transferase [Steroidobacteraceae bacterium]
MSERTTQAPGPLHGIRVLDFTALLQGPLATQVLADLGADVVKLEKQDGEWMRKYGIFMARTHGETDAFLAFNRNKRSVEIDLRDEADRERILELVDRADVVVENFRPGVMDRAGLGYETLRKRNPQLIYAASSGYGQTGPYAKRPGQDYLVQALTGATWLNGRRGDPPFLNALAVTDQYTGLHLVVAILAALQHRNRTGEGQRVDVDLLSCVLALQQQELTVYLNHGNSFERPEENVGHPGITAPCGIYQTQDGYLMLAMFPCPKLGTILGVEWLAPYDTNEKMFEARDIVHRLLSAHFAGHTTQYWIELLSANDVWCAPVQTYADLRNDPQIAHKRLFWEIPYADTHKTYQTVGSPFTFSASPVSVRCGAPRAGQHTEEFRARDIWKD